MTRIRHIRRLAVAPASLAGALLAFAAAAPAALARPGLPQAWQIAVIATRAALAAATVAVLLDRGWAARCRSPLSEA